MFFVTVRPSRFILSSSALIFHGLIRINHWTWDVDPFYEHASISLVCNSLSKFYLKINAGRKNSFFPGIKLHPNRKVYVYVSSLLRLGGSEQGWWGQSKHSVCLKFSLFWRAFRRTKERPWDSGRCKQDQHNSTSDDRRARSSGHVSFRPFVWIRHVIEN